MQKSSGDILKDRAVGLCFACCAWGVRHGSSGLDRVLATRRTPARQPAPSGTLCFPPNPSLTCEWVVSYLRILRSSWTVGRWLVPMFLSMYGISTVMSQLESIFLLSSITCPWEITALFVQGVDCTTMRCSRLWRSWCRGKWRGSRNNATAKEKKIKKSARLPAPGLGSSLLHALPLLSAWRLVLLITLCVPLICFFGYYLVALARTPNCSGTMAVPIGPTSFASLRGNCKTPLGSSARIVSSCANSTFCVVYSPVRMLRAGRWDSPWAPLRYFLACWTTVLAAAGIR